MRRILHMARKEFIQVFQDRRMVAILFIAPVLQLFLFGYAITTDVRNIDVGVMDNDNSADSRELTRAVLNSGYFVFSGRFTSDEEIAGALVHGAADVVLVIPHGFGDDLTRGQNAKVQILLDGSESNSTALAVGYLGKILVSFGDVALEKRTAALSARLGGREVNLPIVRAETRYRFNPELKSSWYMVPGVLGMILMVVTMMMTSLAITREREIGTMEQLIVTPIRPWELLAGKMLPFALVGLVDVTLILVVAMGHFGLPLRGSLGLLYLATGVFLFTTLGLGLLLSTISHTQQQAMFSSFLFMMPAILLSGFMFPIDNMPPAVQTLTYANPLRYYLFIVRAVILKGCGWSVLAPQFAMMFLLGLVLFGLASLRFRKTIQ